MEFRYSFAVLCFLATLSGVSAYGSCSVISIHFCQDSSGLRSFMTERGINIDDLQDTKESKAFTLSDADTRLYCGITDAYFSCLWESVLPYCDTTTRVTIEGVQKGVDYMCHDTLEEYLSEYHQCLGGYGVRMQMASCLDLMENSLTLSDVCRNMNAVVQCIDRAATEECDSAAGRWITHLNYLGLEDLADTISCSLQDPSVPQIPWLDQDEYEYETDSEEYYDYSSEEDVEWDDTEEEWDAYEAYSDQVTEFWEPRKISHNEHNTHEDSEDEWRHSIFVLLACVSVGLMFVAVVVIGLVCCRRARSQSAQYTRQRDSTDDIPPLYEDVVGKKLAGSTDELVSA